MIGAIATHVAGACLLAAVVQLVLWLVARRTGNAGIVDVGWALSFALVIGVFAGSARSSPSAWFPIAAIVIAWSFRLGGYLIARGAATGVEEGRYAELRRSWGPNAPFRFFVLFQIQGVLTGILSLAFVVPFLAPPGVPALCMLGALVGIAGIVGEAVADAQLSQWKRDPARHQTVCDVGLWSYSRHPNYFFEWCVWIGYAVYSLGFAGSGGWIALLPQGVILFSILRVTGIPPTEAQAIRSKGDAYREYQMRVPSAFIPLPPKHT